MNSNTNAVICNPLIFVCASSRHNVCLTYQKLRSGRLAASGGVCSLCLFDRELNNTKCVVINLFLEMESCLQEIRSGVVALPLSGKFPGENVTEAPRD